MRAFCQENIICAGFKGLKQPDFKIEQPQPVICDFGGGFIFTEPQKSYIFVRLRRAVNKNKQTKAYHKRQSERP